MPANLTPDYKKAEQWYRSCSGDAEKLLALQEMLRTIPKHKGTEHMRADIKRKISKLKEAAEGGGKKSGGGHKDIFHVPRSGAGQVVLIGMPNCGKSAIVGAMSKARVHVTDYPFGTDKPVPGMIHHEDVAIEMVDMPPITAEYAAAGQVNTYRGCDIIGIVIDLSGDVIEQMEVCAGYLESHKLLLDDKTELTDGSGNVLGRKAFVICTKSDAAEDGTMETLQELCERDLEFVAVSAETGDGLEGLAMRIFELLDVIRVYSKKPGKAVDMKDPFTLPRGSTVRELAKLVHRELAGKLKSARAWGEGVYDGQNVQRSHVLCDKDIIELHFS